MKKRILYLPIKKIHFDAIARREKPFEFRRIKAHWISRLFNQDGTKKTFDEIYIHNGYRKDRPFMRIKWNDFEYQKYEGHTCYAIDVKEILEIKNWKND